MLLTLLGEFALPHGGSIWTSTIVETMAALGVAERNARQAVARLQDQGVITARRVGRRARWQLSDSGRNLLIAGTERIYGFGADGRAWDGHWLVVLASVREEQRGKRHHLRSQLAFAGFGFLGPGVAISPHVDREELANDVLRQLDLLDEAAVLRAEVGSLVPAEALLTRAWDLDAIAAGYRQFVTRFESRHPTSARARFVALAELVHEWRRFPFGDPEIPAQLLPRHWPGEHAKRLFDDRHAAWSPAANAWYEEIEAGGDVLQTLDVTT
jgi:phenylacetic acid degradation operon negative regulatory protein